MLQVIVEVPKKGSNEMVVSRAVASALGMDRDDLGITHFEILVYGKGDNCVVLRTCVVPQVLSNIIQLEDSHEPAHAWLGTLEFFEVTDPDPKKWEKIRALKYI